tara:strand:- start:236 stop:823 length:588 start_codon:yes stop_codon:yes gene_type:complete
MKGNILVIRKVFSYPKSNAPFRDRFRQVIHNIQNEIDIKDDNLSQSVLNNLNRMQKCNEGIIEHSLVRPVKDNSSKKPKKKRKAEKKNKGKKSAKKKPKGENNKSKKKPKSENSAKKKPKSEKSAKKKPKSENSAKKKSKGEKNKSKKKPKSEKNKAKKKSKGKKSKGKQRGGLRKTCKIQRRIKKRKTLRKSKR